MIGLLGGLVAGTQGAGLINQIKSGIEGVGKSVESYKKKKESTLKKQQDARKKAASELAKQEKLNERTQRLKAIQSKKNFENAVKSGDIMKMSEPSTAGLAAVGQSISQERKNAQPKTKILSPSQGIAGQADYVPEQREYIASPEMREAAKKATGQYKQEQKQGVKDFSQMRKGLGKETVSDPVLGEYNVNQFNPEQSVNSKTIPAQGIAGEVGYVPERKEYSVPKVKLTKDRLEELRKKTKKKKKSTTHLTKEERNARIEALKQSESVNRVASYDPLNPSQSVANQVARQAQPTEGADRFQKLTPKQLREAKANLK